MGRYSTPIIHAPRSSLPVLLSIPHSGRQYGEGVLANAAKGPLALAALEDPLVDRLAWRAIAAGIGAVIQPVPRAVIDCNRGEEELDPAAIQGVPAPVGPRARHGLGLIPSRTHRHGGLWRRPIDASELTCRVEEVYRPYHQALAHGLQALVNRHGETILLDCHSMPSRRPARDEIIIGDRHGNSAAPWVTAIAEQTIRSCGLRVARNDPYAGGEIVGRHGRPAQGIHALQIEIDRSLYLRGDGRPASEGFDRIASLIERLAIDLGQAVLAGSAREAAE